MRPDEFQRQMSGRWARAESIQIAWKKGREESDRQAEFAKEVAAQDEKKHAEFLARMGVS